MKRLITLFLSVVLILSLVGCDTKSMNYIIEHKPSVVGVVEEVHDDYVIMYAENAEGYPNGSSWHIPLDVENQDSYTDVVVGDEIVVYYDGSAMETDPLRVSKIFAITLKKPASREADIDSDFDFSYELIEGTLERGNRICISVALINQRDESYQWTGAHSHFRASVQLLCVFNGEEYLISPEPSPDTDDVADHEVPAGESRTYRYYFNIPSDAPSGEYDMICSFEDEEKTFSGVFTLN